MKKASTYDADVSINSVFQRGKWEFGINSGIMFSPFVGTPGRHVVNYTTTGIQLGYMLSDTGTSGWYRGNFELVGELFGGGVIEGRGDYLAGSTVWIRYNFVPANSKFSPYFQLGGGGEMTDIDQRMLGQKFNFNLDAAAGLRYFVTSRCAVNLEYRFQHFSDAYMTDRNIGINAHGAVLGISWFF